jgi:hypothetical protein
MALKLTQLASKPQLVRIELDDEEIRAKYNDSLEFYIYDRQPLDMFVKLATVGTGNIAELVSIAHSMVLDEHGDPIAHDDLVFPSDIMMKIINKVVDTLGK